MGKFAYNVALRRIFSNRYFYRCDLSYYKTEKKKSKHFILESYKIVESKHLMVIDRFMSGDFS